MGTGAGALFDDIDRARESAIDRNPSISWTHATGSASMMYAEFPRVSGAALNLLA
jgi:hypothetical protein